MAKHIDVVVTIPFSAELISKIKSVSPSLKVRILPARKVEEIPADVWSKAEVLYTDRVLPQPGLVPELRWVQFHFAGIDYAAGSQLLQKDGLVATTLSGTSASQSAEYIVMMLLALGHRMPELFRNQMQKEWPKDRWERFSPFELRNSTVGLIGYGSIARQVARLLQPFGARILTAKRDAMHPEDTGYTQEGIGDPGGDFFTRLYPIQAIKTMLKECDFVVVATPLTAQTRHLLGEEELLACKPGAMLINASRGEVIDQDALYRVLASNHLAGAALDVFSQEPLPADNPLWTLPNTIITPHIAGISKFYNERAVDLFTANLRSYISGETLMNVYHPENEY